MQALPLPKAIYDKCVAQEVVSITLNFRGGSDEGVVDVSLMYEDGLECEGEFVDEINDWFEEAYALSGDGGDGADYGYDITYDFKESTVTIEAWEEKPVYDEADIYTLEVEEAEDA